ncbi:MAG TPA: NADH-quinone oxidoreductase subunit N [Tepidisphaeraceae bacterium]|jgi:NADH-quinone oxidoreductase subunit N
MTQIFSVLWPEILLVAVGSLLLLAGVVQSAAVRRAAPVAALVTLGIVFVAFFNQGPLSHADADKWNTVSVYTFQQYVKLIAAGIGILLMLLAWPTNDDATGNPAIQYGHEAGEFFGLMLLSLAGILFVASANDIIVLFLGIELASIPTYIMVSISRPLPVAQEAGVKYFFLGAMAAAVMLFGFSYLYGTTGQTKLTEIARVIQLGGPNHQWQMMAVIMLLAGFSFKIAAVPLHTYAGDVYQGAATPVMAFLGFVPKTSGFVAILKVLYFVSQTPAGGHWVVPTTIARFLWVIAVLTMFVGNFLGVPQQNVKRVLAYSSVTHTGYMLCGVTALVSTPDPHVQAAALGGVLFYLAAYGIMNTGAAGVLILLPSRDGGIAGYLEPADPETPKVAAATGTSAETFDDIAGQSRRHLFVCIAMAIFCWSLTGLPFTVGFFAKFYLIWPIWQASHTNPAMSRWLVWLGVLLVVNAAISAGYYLRIIGAMFLRGESAGSVPSPEVHPEHPAHLEQHHRIPILHPVPIVAGVALAALGTLLLGVDFPAINHLSRRTTSARIEPEATPASHVANADTPAVVSSR